MRRHTGSLAVMLALALVTGARAGDAGAFAPGAVRETLDKLCCDEFAGREAGKDGGKKAGAWIAEQLKAAGLEPAGDDGTYFQSFKKSGRDMRNVVATLPAAKDSDVANETIVVGSHYDHLGHGNFGALDMLKGRGKLHLGADDNASGSTANLAVARAFAAEGPARRRIVFIWFDGEELGLFGSQAYVKTPAFPLDKTVCMINMDMVGRLRKRLTVHGTNTGSGLLDLVKYVAERHEIELDVRDTMPPNSDHVTFYEKKIPVVNLFTGLHKDYHRATDTPDKIDPMSIARVAQLAYEVARGVAARNDRPTYARAKDGQAEAMLEQIQAMLTDEDLEKIFGGEEGLGKLFKEGGIGKVMERLRGSPGQKPRFGIQIREAEGKGVTVDRVTVGSVAEKAGVRAGDVIASFDGREIDDSTSLITRIREAKGKVKLVVERDGKELTLEADFGASDKPAVKQRWF